MRHTTFKHEFLRPHVFSSHTFITMVADLSLSTNRARLPGVKKLCEFTCKYDYCPESCTCTKVGKLITRPATVSEYLGTLEIHEIVGEANLSPS